MGRGSSGAGTRAKGARASRGAGSGGGGGPGGASGGAGRPAGSSASVTLGPDYTPAQQKMILREFRSLVGKDATIQDAASIVGAPNNSSVVVDIEQSFLSGTRIKVTVNADNLHAERIIFRDKKGDLTLKNEYFTVHKSSQGQGIGASMLARQVEFASSIGVKSIKTEASGNMGLNGYYTWARLGYNAKLGHAVRDTLPAHLKGSRSIHELMRTQAGRDWWKANGTSTNMRFNLAPGSRSQRNLKAYIAERGL